MSDFYPDGYNNMPSESGKYGPYGGRYVPETLMPALDDVIEAYEEFRDDATFRGDQSRRVTRREFWRKFPPVWIALSCRYT